MLRFHTAMAYPILRHNGVDVGKLDFLGPIKFVEPWLPGARCDALREVVKHPRPHKSGRGHFESRRCFRSAGQHGRIGDSLVIPARGVRRLQSHCFVVGQDDRQ